MPVVFVFGTLKRCFPFHERGLGGARFLGEGRTVQSFPMVIAGPWYGPMMFDELGKGEIVRGKIYDAVPDRMPLLDSLETVRKPGNFPIEDAGSEGRTTNTDGDHLRQVA